MIRAALLLAALALAGCAPMHPMVSSSRAGTDLYSHLGGGIASVPADLWSRPGPIAVRGECSSACTAILARADVCTAPDATWRFHGPRLPEATPQAVRAAYVAQVAGWYSSRPGLRAWFLSGDLDPWRTLTGADLHQRHGVPLC